MKNTEKKTKKVKLSWYQQRLNGRRSLLERLLKSGWI